MSHRLNQRVEQLLDSSEEVLDQCALANGAIIAANSDLDIYPSSAENYRFSWARDAAYQLLATHALVPKKSEDRAIRYVRWLKQVRGFAETGLYLKRYSTNGALDVRYGEHFQPDQAGTLIGALDTVIPDSHPDVDEVVYKLASGLSARWNNTGFGQTQDLWENRETVTEDGDVFTYSLAAVRHGLSVAASRFEHVGTAKWEKNTAAMSTLLAQESTAPYLRKIYTSPDKIDTDNSLDASLNGLVYPFSLGAIDQKTTATVHAIDATLFREGLGLVRYKDDTYDGIVREGSRESQAGTWPLLTFWHAIALSEVGAKKKARDVYYDTIDRLDYEFTEGSIPNNYIPEQLYPDAERQGKGVLPLAWSHAKFILATKALEILK